MSEDIERKVVYVYSVVDQMSKEHEKMAATAKKAGDESSRTADAQKGLSSDVRRTSDEISSQASLASSKASDVSSAMAGAESSARSTGNVTEDTIAKQRELSSDVRRTSDEISSQASLASSKASDVSSAMAGAESSARSTGNVTDDTIAKQRELSSETKRTSAEVQAQNVSTIMQLTAIMGFREGITSLTNGMIQLGLVNDETAAKLMKFNSAFQMFAGGVQILKAAQGMMAILNASTLKNAILNTYNSIITNPGMAVAVGVGIGAAAGVGAYYALNSTNSTNVSNTITIQGAPTAGQEQTAEKVQQVYSLTGAGGYA